MEFSNMYVIYSTIKPQKESLKVFCGYKCQQQALEVLMYKFGPHDQLLLVLVARMIITFLCFYFCSLPHVPTYVFLSCAFEILVSPTR